MKKSKIVIGLLLVTLLFSGCTGGKESISPEKSDKTEVSSPSGETGVTPTAVPQEELYAGFSEDAPADFSKITILCLSGSAGCYTTQGNTLTFTNVSEDSVYAISGELNGNIVIDVGDDYKFDLEMHGFTISNDSVSPITILSGDKVTLTAKKGYQNYIYDMRGTLDEESEQEAGAVCAQVDFRLAGKGELTIVSEGNNGVHSKKDLEVKNLTLTIQCVDNALKGNDSVTLENATTTLIATAGDGVKTTNSDISKKGNQRGTITIQGGTHTIYAACDGLDAAYDVTIAEETTVLNVFTDKYSEYSKEVTAVAESTYYIRSRNGEWKYSVKAYNADGNFVWMQPEYHSKVSGGRSDYIYYSFPKDATYATFQLFVYDENMEQGQEEEYLAASDYIAYNENYDTIALENRGEELFLNWTNYTTKISKDFGGGFGGGHGGFGGPGRPGGPGADGWMEGNSDKGDYSTKGIKAANEIIISAGTVYVKAYDDALHADAENTLENGETPKGNVTITGGTLTLYSNDDGINAEGTVTISDGIVKISDSYEGIEGNTVEILGGKVSVVSKDDGINGTAPRGTAVAIRGGEVYIYSAGDGIDSNAGDMYEGILFEGGNTLVISTSRGNSSIDSERGYQYEGGSVVAVMSSGGMSREAVNCKNFSEVASKQSVRLAQNAYATVTVNNEAVMSFSLPEVFSGEIVYLGSNEASVSVTENIDGPTDENNVLWYKK